MTTVTDIEAYSQMVNDVIDKSFVATILSMAYELGILKLLSDTQKPMTSHEIADARDLKERYVREAMNSLASADIVGVSKDEEGLVRFHLTPEQGAAIQNCVMIGLVASQSTRYLAMVDRFKKDGPYDLPYSDDKWAMRGIEQACVARLDETVDLVLKVVPGVREKLETGIRAIEFGSGLGLLFTAFASKFPKTTFVGSDVTEPAAQLLKERCSKLKLHNADIRRLDLLNVPDDLTGQFDFAFVNDVIHDLPDSLQGLRGFRKVLKPGSYFAMIDIDGHSDVMVNKAHPGVAGMYAVSTFHCVAQGYQSEDSAALGACWGRDVALSMIEKAGFRLESLHAHCNAFVLYVCQAV